MVAGIVILAGSGSAAAGGQTGRPDYLAGGDSITFGRRASDPATTGYVPILATHLATVVTPGNAPAMPAAASGNYFGYVNLARLGSETTTTMIANGQLGELEAYLLRHNRNPSPYDDVEVVTFSMGGNDLLGLLAFCVVSPAGCAAAIGPTLATIGANLDVIMSRLRGAAGPDTVIATMTYYNPLVGPLCTPPPALAPLVPLVLAAVNGIITATAATYGILVAPVHAAGIGEADLFGDCIHPNDSGYAKIAATFQAVIDPALP